ncbi:WD40 repeat-like protein [Rhizopogon salebrosus TDB-379]|nr:WD40 repeat-like protein [Rhizopogon salebrosus TDB-379]
MDMASRSTRSTRTRKMIVGMTLVGHERSFYYMDGERREYKSGPTIAYFPDGHKIISGSWDKTTRLWDLQAGKEIEEARVVGEQKVDAVAVSSDGRWVVTGGGLGGVHKLKANEVKTGSVKTFEGHSLGTTCIDISMDSKLLASGSLDGRVRVWSLDTGELVAGPFGSSDLPGGVGAVRFSHDSRKLAVRSEFESWLEVWDIQAQKLDNKVGTGGGLPSLPRVPVFWTTKDRTIVAAFCFTDGDDDPAKTIYEFDSSTLKTVGTSFEGHTSNVTSLALSNDSTLLASASYDTIKLWAFESRQLIASFDDTPAYSLALSPDSHKLAYTIFNHGTNIYICDIPPDILASVWPAQEAVKTIEHEHSQPSDQLNACDPADATRRPAAVSRRPRRRSPAIYPQQPTFIHQLRKLFPSSFCRNLSPVHYDERRDLLNVPAPSRLSPSGPPSGHAATQVHSGVDYDENPRRTSAPAITQSSATTSTIGTAQRLLSWWSSNIGRTPMPIVDVSLAPGQLRIATSGAPQVHEDIPVRPEDFDSSDPSPNPNLLRPSEAVQMNAGEHRGGPFCCCL